MPRHKQPPELPPKVAAHVQQQLLLHDWDAKLQELTHLCEGCPARPGDDVCDYCPLEGAALTAATIAMRARIAKLQAASQNGKKGKAALSEISKKMEGK